MRLGAPAGLPLRDIHLPSAPSWWPPAPGWWVLAAAIVVVLAVLLVIRRRRQRRHRALQRLFDDAIAAAPTPAARVAAMSELLRRAARRIDPSADTLAGDDWLRFLDRDSETPVFQSQTGKLLLDAAFRRDVLDADAEALRGLARERFLAWMAR
jgi:CBS-domain-containing membrane protein